MDTGEIFKRQIQTNIFTCAQTIVHKPTQIHIQKWKYHFTGGQYNLILSSVKENPVSWKSKAHHLKRNWTCDSKNQWNGIDSEPDTKESPPFGKRA